MGLGQQPVPETKIHFILSSPRRLETLRYLTRKSGRITLRELSEYVAAAETGEVPPPRQARETVYVSLHQTHIPALEDLGIIEYDNATKEIVSFDPSRDLRVYMEVVTRFGITWDEYYRYLGVLALLIVVATETGVPLISGVEPLVVATVFLALFAISTLFQFRRVGGVVRNWVGRIVERLG